MNVSLRVRPINTVKHEIVLPRAARSVVVKQQRSVTKTLRAVMRAKPTIQMPQQVYKQPAVTPKKGGVARQSVGVKPTVKIITRDPPEASVKKIRELRNSCVGRTLVIIGNGPSILEIDTALLVGKPYIDIMSINKPDMRVWPTKYWLFCDISQLKRHHDLWDNYNGCIFNSTMIADSRPGTIFIKNKPGFGFSLDLTSGFHIGRSSVYAAMQVSNWLGYDKTYILGIDMGAVKIDGKETLHFYGVNPDCPVDNRKKRFEDEVKYYDDAAHSLPEEIRKKFYFCSSYNKFRFLDSFHRLDHKQAIQEICSI
jgi:hypothetical protein